MLVAGSVASRRRHAATRACPRPSMGPCEAAGARRAADGRRAVRAKRTRRFTLRRGVAKPPRRLPPRRPVRPPKHNEQHARPRNKPCRAAHGLESTGPAGRHTTRRFAAEPSIPQWSALENNRSATWSPSKQNTFPVLSAHVSTIDKLVKF